MRSREAGKKGRERGREGERERGREGEREREREGERERQTESTGSVTWVGIGEEVHAKHAKDRDREENEEGEVSQRHPRPHHSPQQLLH